MLSRNPRIRTWDGDGEVEVIEPVSPDDGPTICLRAHYHAEQDPGCWYGEPDRWESPDFWEEWTEMELVTEGDVVERRQVRDEHELARLIGPEEARRALDWIRENAREESYDG